MNILKPVQHQRRVAVRGPCPKCMFVLSLSSDDGSEVLCYCRRAPAVPSPLGTLALWPPVTLDQHCNGFRPLTSGS